MSGRVRESHQFTRKALLASMCFGVIAVVWAAVIASRGGSWWGPLHAFVAGAVLLAISGTSQMFTVTWATTSPPSWRTTTWQRWLLIGGVLAVLIGIPNRLDPLVWVGAAMVVASLVILTGSIRAAIQRSLLRRFDLASRFYIVAFVAGMVGVVLGATIGTGHAIEWFGRVRLVHSHLNLLGLIGLTIIGTIPTFLATTAYHKAVSGKEARVGWYIGIAGVIAILGGLWWPELVGAGTIAIAVAGTSILVGIVVRLWERGRSRLAFLQISLGTSWLILWAFADGVGVLRGDLPTAFSPSTAALVVAGIGQVLLGAFSYLLPVLKGSPFSENRRIMQERPAIPIIAANLAAVLFSLSLAPAALAFAAVWIGDFAMRAIRVMRS